MDIPRHLIGVAAQKSELSPDTLRGYDNEIKPFRDSSGRRLYTDADIANIREISKTNRSRWPHLAELI